MNKVNVIGAGLAGCECAYHLANHGVKVKLYEMKPHKKSPAHVSDKFAELVCSNSLKSYELTNACGLLKEEMKMLGSIFVEAAYKSYVPAGKALAVDREKFSSYITDKIKENKNIEIIDKEVENIEDLDGITVIATGPLTSDKLSSSIMKLIGNESMYFYDAAAPIIDAASIDMKKAYRKDRYGIIGEGDYLNLAMTKEEYEVFFNALVGASSATRHDFDTLEKIEHFEGCMPIEAMAKRGEKTLLFGPLKPVGLYKEDGTKPYAVVQLRVEDKMQTMYNLVGFQTHLKWPEQKRVFSMIPGLEKAKFTKYGVMHRNSYIDAPVILNETYQTKKYPNIFFAGQLSGVEGYVESAASGIVAAINMDRYLQGKKLHSFSRKTAMGSMAYYITHANPEGFEPMNANFGIMEDITIPHKKKERKALYAKIALEEMEKEKELIMND